MIAQRMKELLNTGVVLDKETGEYRPVHYRDMVILTRSLQGNYRRIDQTPINERILKVI